MTSLAVSLQWAAGMVVEAEWMVMVKAELTVARALVVEDLKNGAAARASLVERQFLP
jgi:hypothetical protein